MVSIPTTKTEQNKNETNGIQDNFGCAGYVYYFDSSDETLAVVIGPYSLIMDILYMCSSLNINYTLLKLLK